jgi:hypothetical protein
MKAFTYPEGHDEAIPFFKLFQMLKKQFQNASVRDFSMADLLKPEPSRMKMLLSGILNYKIYLDHKTGEYNSARDSILSVQENLELVQYQTAQEVPIV